MPETMQDSAIKFAVGQLGKTDCQLLTKMGHVTHVESALEVLRDGRIRPKLVFDGSRLDTERVDQLKKQLNILPDYFVAVVEDPTAVRLTEICRDLRVLLG